MSEPRDEFERRFAQRYADYLADGVAELDTKKPGAGFPTDEPPRARRLRMAILGTATVAVAATVTLAASGVLPKITGPVGTATPSPHPSALATATVQPTPTATPSQSVAVARPTVAPSEASVPSSLDGQEFAFWTLYRPPPCCGSTLRISTSSGSSEAIFDIPDYRMSPEFWPAPAGPKGGRVVYVVDDGRTAHLRVADAWTGENSELTSTGLVIARVALDPAGSTVYYLLFDRKTSAFEGLWAISTSGGPPTSVQVTTGMATLAATRVYVEPQLAVSDDGSWIAYVICHTIDCEFHATHEGGRSEPLDWSNFHAGDQIAGITGDLLIGSSECVQPTCDGFVLDLRTGERWPLGGDGTPFAPRGLIVGPHGPLVLGETEDYDQGRWRVEVLDLTSGSRTTAFEATFQPGISTVRLAEGYSWLDSQAGAELPPGWFLIYRFANADALLLPADYSAATIGAAQETRLPFMKPSDP
ncbi:MAG TPA: hypothetical protein VK838_04595 [Candidatus Limnocylindrales bacterium]|nr:hypothetical protein [Candidatus Limnocylindrales bacterium]